jgi:hypothetical protein
MFSSFSRNVIPIQPEMKKYIMESTEKSMEKYRKPKPETYSTNNYSNQKKEEKKI